MDNDIENIFSRQAEVLPDEVRRFVASGLWEGPLDDIIAHYNLSEDDIDSLRTEISLVLAGLVHPNEFRAAIGGEMPGADSATLDALAGETEANVFAPIRPMLERFFSEQEGAEREEVRPLTSRSEVAPPPATPLARMRDVAPDNLPTGEIQGKDLESDALKPGLGSKMRPADDAEAVESGEAHPFEVKMKKVFTGGTADMGELAIETPASPAGRVTNDPYREPIE